MSMKCKECGSEMNIEKYSYTVIAECINCCCVVEVGENDAEEDM